jgi:GNAT superfamily N-acetyltransferase
MIQLANEKDYEVCVEQAKKDKNIKAFCATSFRWGWEDNLYVYKENDIVMGFVQFALLKRIPKSSLYYIYSFQEFRGKGIGKLLFQFFLEKSKGRILYWKVNKKNDEANNFYNRFGFFKSDETEKEFIYLTKVPYEFSS